MASESLGALLETCTDRAKGVVLVKGKSDVIFLRRATNSLKKVGYINKSLEEAVRPQVR